MGRAHVEWPRRLVLRLPVVRRGGRLPRGQPVAPRRRGPGHPPALPAPMALLRTAPLDARVRAPQVQVPVAEVAEGAPPVRRRPLGPTLLRRRHLDALSVQRRLDGLSAGRWRVSTVGAGAGTGAAAARRGPEPSGATSAADAATDAAAVWEPMAGPLRQLDSAVLRHCFGRSHIWVHLVGDSTVRFMCAWARVEGRGQGTRWVAAPCMQG